MNGFQLGGHRVHGPLARRVSEREDPERDVRRVAHQLVAPHADATRIARVSAVRREQDFHLRTPCGNSTRPSSPARIAVGDGFGIEMRIRYGAELDSGAAPIVPTLAL